MSGIMLLTGLSGLFVWGAIISIVGVCESALLGCVIAEAMLSNVCIMMAICVADIGEVKTHEQ